MKSIADCSSPARSSSVPAKIVLCYLGWLALAVVLCCQVGLLPQYASESKPYSRLFLGETYKGLDSESSPKIIFLGDSSIFGPRGSHTPDLLRRALSHMAPDSNIVISEWAFLSAQMYHFYCLLHRAMKFSPDLVIIPINWNSLGLYWKGAFKENFPELCALAPLSDDLPPDMVNPIRHRGISPARQLQYKLEIYALYPIGFRSLARESFRFIMSRGTRQSEKQKVTEAHDRCQGGARSSNRVFLERAYPMHISETNEICLFIRTISHESSRHGTKILFYISPINREHLSKLGHFDRDAFDASKKIIMEQTMEPHIYCIDLSEILMDEEFLDVVLHYCIDGRTKVADSLAVKTLEIFAENDIR